MSQDKYSQKSAWLEYLLDKSAGQYGRTSGFVKRQSKLSAEVFVKGVVLGWTGQPEGSLSMISEWCAEQGVSISPAGLHQRMTENAVRLLRMVFQEGLRLLPKGQRLPEAVLSHFNAIHILDSTLIHLPDGLSADFAGHGGTRGAAAAKICLSFDYRSGSFGAVEVVAGRVPDQKCNLHTALAQPGSLHVFDLGFFKQQVFVDLANAGAFFVSRLQTQTAVSLEPDGEALDLTEWLATFPGRQGEVDVYLGQQAHLPVRLIFQHLPHTIVAERRRQAHLRARKRGKTCSNRQLQLLAWTCFITNAPPIWLSPEQVALVYRIRWQIELLFKLWKSQARLDWVGHCRRNRFLCQLYARLIGLLVFQWLLSDWPLSAELSPVKAFALFQRHLCRWLYSLAHDCDALPTLLANWEAAVHRSARTQHRRSTPSTFTRLLLAGP